MSAREGNGLMGWLDGQVALVTGGGSGIGRAVVARYIEEGARVGVMERVATRADQLRHEFGDKVVGIAGDVALLADNKRAVAETVRAFGHLDIFVANAGIFDVYAKGVILGAKASLPELTKTAGCMVFTASVAGFNSGGGGSLYTASKHAVVGLIRQLAVELGPQIRVNGVAPGGTSTDLRGLMSLGNDDRSQFAAPGMADQLRAHNPLQIALEPPDIAGAYVFLSSRTSARGITGTVVRVDAGGMLRMPRQR